MARIQGHVSEINREEMNALTDAQKENYGGTYHMGKHGENVRGLAAHRWL